MALEQLTRTQLPNKPKQIIEEWLPQVIIIDDDIELLEELKDGISFNYNVETLSNSTHAFDMVYELNPDLIILDIKMSPKSGFHLANEFSNFKRTKFIPIILITGFYVQEEHPMMKLLGIKHIMFKPFNLDELLEKMELVLNKSNPAKQDKEDDGDVGRKKKRW